MSRTIRLGILTLLLLLFVAMPGYAQRLDETYSDDVVTFSYPSDWFKCTCPEDENTLAIGNTEEAPSSADLQRDEVQLLIIKSAEIFVEDNLNVDFDAETPEDVLVIYFQADEDELDLYEFDDDRTAAAYYVTNRDARLEVLFLSVDLGDDSLGMFVATARIGDLEQFEETIFAIAETFVATSTLEGDEDNEDNDEDRDEIELTENFELDDESFEVDYPEDWIAVEDDGIIIIVNDEAVLDIQDLADLRRAEILILIYPTVDSLPDYDFEVDRGTVPSTIVSYYASMAMITGMEQQGAMEEPEIGDGDLLASSVYSILEDEYDQYVLAVENGEDDIITLFAYTAPEEMPEYQAILEAIAASYQVH